MTMHLCAAVRDAEPSVAAGAEAVPMRARTARPATTPTATSRRVERKLRRICGPFSPGVGRWGVDGHTARKRFRNCYHCCLGKVKRRSHDFSAPGPKKFPEHASM